MNEPSFEPTIRSTTIHNTYVGIYYDTTTNSPDIDPKTAETLVYVRIDKHYVRY